MLISEYLFLDLLLSGRNTALMKRSLYLLVFKCDIYLSSLNKLFQHSSQRRIEPKETFKEFEKIISMKKEEEKEERKHLMTFPELLKSD